MTLILASFFDPQSLAELGLRLLGAFYLLGGVVACRAAATDRLLDLALSGVSLKPTPMPEKLRGLWLLSASLIVAAGGLALIMLLDLALPLFLLSAVGQALYIFVLAPRYFDKDDEPDPGGRRNTTNAFYLYCIATAFVGFAALNGMLIGWETLPLWLPEVVVGAFMLWAGYTVFKYCAPFAKLAGHASVLDNEREEFSGFAPHDVPSSLLLSPVWHGVPFSNSETSERLSGHWWLDDVDSDLQDELNAWLSEFRRGDLIEVDGHACFKDGEVQAAWEAKGRALAERSVAAFGVAKVEFSPRIQPFAVFTPSNGVVVEPENYLWALWTGQGEERDNICPENLGVTGLLARDFVTFSDAFTDGYYDREYTPEDGRPDLIGLKTKAVHDLGYRLKQALVALGKPEIDVSVWEDRKGYVSPRAPNAV